MYTSSLAENPSAEAYRSVNHNDSYTVKVFVSIGTGKRRGTEPKFTSKSTMKSVSIPLESPEDIHRHMLSATKHDTLTDYYRLNVEHGLDSLVFDEWKGKKGIDTLDLIRIRTEEYLLSPDAKSDITKIAKQLVTIRRERSTWEPDLDRWERFCHGVEYACPVSTCQNAAVKYKTRGNLQDHVKATHSIEPDELESLLDAGKRFPLDEVLE